jgi:glutamate synthase domain-containing protein 3
MTVLMNTRVFDLADAGPRELNAALHALRPDASGDWRVLNPRGRHAIAAGINADITIEVLGHVGYYCAGMNQRATVIIQGNASTGVAENMMSGTSMCKAMPASRRALPRMAGCS